MPPIVRRPFPNRLLAFPNLKHGFGTSEPLERPMRIVRSFDYPDIGRVHLTTIGAIGFDFDPQGSLASIDALDFRGSGAVPDEVMSNRDALNDLQQRRQMFMNFISAALFGRIAGALHRSLTGAQYCTLDRIFSFTVSGEEIFVEPHPELSVLATTNLMHLRGQPDSYRIPEADLDDAIAFIVALIAREALFEHADLRSCLVMNYQAAILHNQQHAAGSLALNVALLETLIWEIFLSYGLVGTRTPQPFCTKSHTVTSVSNGQFSKMTLRQRIEALAAGHLIDSYLSQRLERARDLRNDLMHKGQMVSPVASGECQTAVRDVWALLIEAPFELNAGWTYRNLTRTSVDELI